MIDWCAFNWNAITTLTTGVLAVCAAVFVGNKQTAIQDRQAKIQEAALRSDLFDRRYNIFETSEKFLSEILQTARPPSNETEREFIVAKGQARFLFAVRVQGGLDDIWRKSVEFQALKATMSHTFNTQGHYGDGNPERERVALEWFIERFRTLPDLFDELKLSGAI